MSTTLRVFKKLDGTIVNPISHTREVFANHPEAVMYIGTDSQNHEAATVYATVIAYRYGTNGVHYITQKFIVPMIKDMSERLLKEVEYSIECADHLKANKLGYLIESIDLDFNSDDRWGSNRLLTAAEGWVIGMGYKARVKIKEADVKDDEILIASKAADYQVRHLNTKEEKKANKRRKRKVTRAIKKEKRKENEKAKK